MRTELQGDKWMHSGDNNGRSRNRGKTRRGATETKRHKKLSGTQPNKRVEKQKMVEIILCTVTRCLPQKMFTHTPTSTPMVFVYYPATPTFPARLNGDSEGHNLHERRPRSPTRRRSPLLRCTRQALQGPQGAGGRPCRVHRVTLSSQA